MCLRAPPFLGTRIVSLERAWALMYVLVGFESGRMQKFLNVLSSMVLKHP